MSDYQPHSFDPHTADKSYTGAGFFDAALSLNDAVNENDKVSIGLGAAGLALETIGLVLDPLGSLLTAGIGWLIEHVGPLRWPLDVLAGDPEGIAAAQEMLDDVKQNHLDNWVKTHQDALNAVLDGWTGEAADAFKKDMDAVTGHLQSLSGTMASAGTAMKVAGGFIGVTRGLLRDLIAMLLANLIKGAIIAVALSWITFGGSIAAFIGQAIIEVSVFLSRAASELARMGTELGKLVKSLTKVGKSTDDLGKVKVPGKPSGTGGSGGAPKTDPVPTGGKPKEPPKVNEPADPPPPPPGGKPGDPVKEPPKVTEPADAPPPPPAGGKPGDPVKGPPKVNEPADAPPPPPAGGKQGDPVQEPPKVNEPADGTPPPAGGKPADPPADPPQEPPTVNPQGGTDPATATPPPAGGKPADPPETPTGPKPTDQQPPAPTPTPTPTPGGKPTTPDPKPADPPATPPKQHGPKKTPYNDVALDKFKNYFQQRVVANNPHISPQQLDVLMKKFDAAANMSVLQLGKVIGPENAEAFERAIKTMTDPWFGKRGLGGKSIVDLIKGMPTSLAGGGGDDDS